MKLKSLKSSRFEALKANEIQNAFAVLGGRGIGTCESKVDSAGVKHVRADSYDNVSNPGGSRNVPTPDWTDFDWDKGPCATIDVAGNLHYA